MLNKLLIDKKLNFAVDNNNLPLVNESFNSDVIILQANLYTGGDRIATRISTMDLIKTSFVELNTNNGGEALDPTLLPALEDHYYKTRNLMQELVNANSEELEYAGRIFLDPPTICEQTRLAAMHTVEAAEKYPSEVDLVFESLLAMNQGTHTLPVFSKDLIVAELAKTPILGNIAVHSVPENLESIYTESNIFQLTAKYLDPIGVSSFINEAPRGSQGQIFLSKLISSSKQELIDKLPLEAASEIGYIMDTLKGVDIPLYLLQHHRIAVIVGVSSFISILPTLNLSGKLMHFLEDVHKGLLRKTVFQTSLFETSVTLRISKNVENTSFFKNLFGNFKDFFQQTNSKSVMYDFIMDYRTKILNSISSEQISEFSTIYEKFELGRNNSLQINNKGYLSTLKNHPELSEFALYKEGKAYYDNSKELTELLEIKNEEKKN
jgi:hypothetical protein